MLCNRKKSSPCLFLLVVLLGAILAGCGGDEPAPAPPPPPPPPPPAFVPVDVSIELGTSGETLTLQTTESGGFTRNGEAFASGTTVEAAGNTYRLVLQDGEWAAEYVAPRPWVTALGRSGDAVLITRAENGFYEVGEGDDKRVFPSGGTLTASNGNEYRLTLNEDTNSWQVEYVPPEPAAVALGMSGETVLVERLEGGGYSVGGQRVADGSTFRSASGNTYRLAMQDGAWTATFVPPAPVLVSLGTSGQTLALQLREDGQYEKNGQLFPSGSTEMAGGNTYRLVFQNGAWTAEFVPQSVVVQLGTSGLTVTLQELENGQFTKNGQLFPSGSTEVAGGNTYRLVLQNGTWTAEFVPRSVVVQLGASGESVTLMEQQDGTFTRDGRPFQSNRLVETAAGNRYRLILRNGQWTAMFEAPAEVVVRLGRSGETVTLVAQEDNTYTRNGERFLPNTIVEAGGNEYRLVFEGGEWQARYVPERIPVLGGDDLILLFRQEDGTFTDTNNETVRDGDVVQVDGTSYELTYLPGSRRWVATRTSGTTPGSVTVDLPGGGTITLTRTSGGTYTYEDRPVSSGDQITVGGTTYRLSESNGSWTATATTPGTAPGNPGSVEGPTEFDELDDFTEDATRFEITTTNDSTAGGNYSVKFARRGTRDLFDRGTKVVPTRLVGDGTTASPADNNRHEFPVYDLFRQSVTDTETRTFVEVAKAKLEEIIEVITSNKSRYNREVAFPDEEIQGSGPSDDDALWNQARNAVGRIFGKKLVPDPTNAPNTVDGEVQRILGDPEPWPGDKVEADEVDSVINALRNMVDILSDVNRFGRNFDDLIDTENTGKDAQDYFDGVMSRVRFGSTTNTRYGAYAVKKANQDAADTDDTMWDTGVFFYTPSDEPMDPDDIPTRGTATYTGNTVAAETHAGFRELYSGKIELTASFAKQQIDGKITSLTDEDGNSWEVRSDDTFRDELVDSINLPVAKKQDAKTGVGYFESDSTGDDSMADIVFDSNLPNKSVTSSFKVQLIEEGTEALGVWTATLGGAADDLEGAFGATRSGTPTRPRLPTETDRGGVVVSQYTMGEGSFSQRTLDEKWVFTLTKAQIGDVGDDDQLEFTTENLYSRSSHPKRGGTYVRDVVSKITTIRNAARDDVAGDNPVDNSATRLYTGVNAQLDRIAIDNGLQAPSSARTDTAANFRADVQQILNALGNETNFFRAVRALGEDDVTANGFLVDAFNYSPAKIAIMFDELTIDFRLRTARTTYTRFGVWSQRAAANAFGADLSTGASADNDIEFGSFAFGPRSVEATNTLTFVAEYSGEAFAVETDSGNLYHSRSFDLIVNWGAAAGTSDITATITDLRGVGGVGATTSLFKHENRDVKSIFLSNITVGDNNTIALSDNGAVRVRVRYTDSSVDDATFTATGTMDGGFIGDSAEGPLGVLGTWSIPADGALSKAMTGSFGADLQQP